jgi:hypothetical protein
VNVERRKNQARFPPGRRSAVRGHGRQDPDGIGNLTARVEIVNGWADSLIGASGIASRLAASAPLLAECIGGQGLETAGREVAVGEQVAGSDALGRRRWDCGDGRTSSREAHGRAVVIEAQPAMPTTTTWKAGDLRGRRAGRLVGWAVAAVEPPFLREHMDALAGLNEAFAGRRRFTVCRPKIGFGSDDLHLSGVRRLVRTR